MDFVLMLFDLLPEDDFVISQEAEQADKEASAFCGAIGNKIDDTDSMILDEMIGRLEHSYLKMGFINGWLMARKCFQGLE